MRKKVLVFPCGSEIGLEIYRSLQYSTHFELIGGSSVSDHGEYVYQNYIDGIPNVDDSEFIPAIRQIIAEHSIDYIFPAHDSVVLLLAEMADKGQIDAIIVGSPYQTCGIARSKRATYKYFENILNVPQEYQRADVAPDFDFPVFLKPDVGQGSRGTAVVRDEGGLDFHLTQDPSLMILEYLPGAEYTIDCFTTTSGELLVAEPRERTRISNGISVRSQNSNTNHEDFFKIANTINDKLKFRGVWFFQLKRNRDNELVMLEVAPRVAGTMGLIRCRGVNLALMSLFDLEGYPVEAIFNDYDIQIDRALENKYKINIDYSHVYIDYDDLIVRDGEVYPAAVAFLYQCLNRGVVLHLITKHAEEINASLANKRLSGLFDEIIHLDARQEKADFIKETHAIFIDDSFAERKKVADKLNIPVFDLHMMESLTG